MSKHDPKTVPYLASAEDDGVHCAVCGLLFPDYREVQPHWIERMREEGIQQHDPLPVVRPPEPRHPMQPLVRDKYGEIRFKENAIVRWLVERSPETMSDIERIVRGRMSGPRFTDEDQTQLAQLIGYSLSRYPDLGYVSDDDYAKAVEAAKELDAS